MAELSWKTVTQQVDVEVYTTKDGKVFEGPDAQEKADDHEGDLENREGLDALFARDPAEVKAAIFAYFASESGEGRYGLSSFLDGVSKLLPAPSGPDAFNDPNAPDDAVLDLLQAGAKRLSRRLGQPYSMTMKVIEDTGFLVLIVDAADGGGGHFASSLDDQDRLQGTLAERENRLAVLRRLIGEATTTFECELSTQRRTA